MAGLLNGHAFLFAEFAKQLGILLALFARGGVDEGGFADVAEAPLLCLFKNLIHVSQDDEVGNSVSQNLVGGFQCALFSAFGQHDALLVGFGASNELFYEFH